MEVIKRKWAYGALAALLVFLILLPFDWFLGKYTFLMVFIGIYAIVTIGLCLLMGYTGQVSLGQAAFFGIGAYVSAILSKTYDVNPWLAMLIAAMATGIFAYIIGLPIFRLRGNYLAMATLGLGIIIYIVFRQMAQYTGGPDGMGGIPNLSVGGFVFDTPFKRYFLVWFVCLTIVLISQNIVRSRTGRALMAIHASEPAAQSVGVNVSQFKVKVFVLSAVYASVAGSLYVHHMRFINPQPFDFLASVTLITMAVVGGLASIWGAIFGAATIKLISNEILVELGQLYSKITDLDVVIFGAILMLVMIFLPKGLFVSLRDAFDAWRKKRAQRGAMT